MQHTAACKYCNLGFCNSLLFNSVLFKISEVKKDINSVRKQYQFWNNLYCYFWFNRSFENYYALNLDWKVWAKSAILWLRYAKDDLSQTRLNMKAAGEEEEEERWCSSSTAVHIPKIPSESNEKQDCLLQGQAQLDQKVVFYFSTLRFRSEKQ